MAKPADRGGGGGCRLSLVSLGVALAAAAAVALCVMCLDARRQDQLAELREQLTDLRQLADSMRNQLDRHEEQINSTLHAKHTVSSEPAEEVVYEDEYEYDDEDGSYEYDDEDEPNTKATVKRTAVLGDSAPSTNSTAPLGPTKPHKHVHMHKATPRTRRDVRSQAVPVREERYVPSTPHLKTFFNHKNKSEGLRIYASYFDKPQKNTVSPERSRRYEYSMTGPRTFAQEPRSSHQITEHSPMYQEQRRPKESVVRLRHKGRNRNGNLDEVELIAQNSAEEFAPPHSSSGQQVNLLAAHFVGDLSKYNQAQANHYGNSVLNHPHGLFMDWLPSNWMYQLGTYMHFPISGGKVTIQNPGVYFVYAQVYYAVTQDRAGFHIKHNDAEVAQCTTTATGRADKRYTCFTAVTLQLSRTDQLWISEVEGLRNTSFKSSHSFFGLIQLVPT